MNEDLTRLIVSTQCQEGVHRVKHTRTAQHSLAVQCRELRQPRCASGGRGGLLGKHVRLQANNIQHRVCMNLLMMTTWKSIHSAEKKKAEVSGTVAKESKDNNSGTINLLTSRASAGQFQGLGSDRARRDWPRRHTSTSQASRSRRGYNIIKEVGSIDEGLWIFSLEGGHGNRDGETWHEKWQVEGKRENELMIDSGCFGHVHPPYFATIPSDAHDERQCRASQQRRAATLRAEESLRV